MTTLITNDDGYTDGLKALFNASKSLDKNSYAIIPNKQRSAVSKAITLHKPIRIHKVEKDIYSLNGTPADCTTFGLFCKDFKKPSLVLSGINWGDNTSLHSIYGSGTIAACTEAALYNIPAIAFSLYVKKHRWNQEVKDWGNLKALSKKTLEIIKKLKNKFQKNMFFSVNFPENFSTAKIKIAKPQKERFTVKIVKRKDPDKRTYYWITGPDSKKEKNSDFSLVSSGNIVITPIYLSYSEKLSKLVL